MNNDTDENAPRSTGDFVPGQPVTDAGPQTTPGITSETAPAQTLQNKWTADHVGNIPTPADPDKLIPPTPRADPEKEREEAARETEPMRAEDVNKTDAELRDEDKGEAKF